MKFGTIIADPPWNYGGTSGDKRLRGYSDVHYQPLTTDVLASLPVGNIVTDDAVLFLWTNGPFLANGDTQRIAIGWGFTPVTLMYWNKVTSTNGGQSLFGSTTHRGGVGYWFRGNCEPILVGKRKKSYRWAGHPDWDASDTCALFTAPKTRHSQKPVHLHELVERSVYQKPYLEIFGRRPRAGWTVVGAEMPLSEDVRISIKRLESLP